MEYNEKTLLVRARKDGPVLNAISAEKAGWELLNFEAWRFEKNASWESRTGENEAALVVLGGQCAVESNKGMWIRIGRRPGVFGGMPYALYLPRRTEFKLVALTDGLEVGYGWAPTDEDHPARLITPADSEIEIRGGHQATRQINSIIPPGFDCHRLVVCEVYTPGGNWSSYPPHKHDVHVEDAAGNLVEADLEEIYYYKIDKPRGYAIQRVYTDDRSIDSAVVAHSNDIVLVPAGYHPVSAAYGYNCYYLNFLAGSAQALTARDDPAYAWTKETWTAKDPRLPMVTRGMEG
ncbi:MAG: 5-deoxy-glucuronate isomerase [Anaerolineae bacterium]|nr:5-deoxy-glucuronate isomerase [Anaerolineae bacterium]